MDLFSLNELKQQWLVFWSAPYIILPFVVIFGSAVWWFRGWISRERILVLNERKDFATDQKAKSDRDLEELKKQFEAYKTEVAAEGSDASPEKVDAAIVRVVDSNTSIGSMLVKLYGNLDAGEY